MVVKKVQITVLMEDTKNSTKPTLKAKHGLSFFITATIDDKKATILMDTGPSPDALLNNANELGVNLEDVDVVVLSHGHYDHTGGLMSALKQMKKRVPVIGHPQLFDPKLKMTPYLKLIGAPFKLSDVESAGGVPLLVTGSMKVADGITTTGEVPRMTEFEKVKGFWTIRNRNFTDDAMVDDQSLVIDVDGKGLVVLSGCAHSGIINIIKHAQRITGNSKVYAVLGGFHLISSDNETVQLTVDALKEADPKMVAPCHCTGKKATKMINEAFEGRCRSLCVGDVIEL